MIKVIKMLGLILFTAAFCLFNSLFFVSDYTITQGMVAQKITETAKANLFWSEWGGQSSYTSSYSFAAHVQITCDRVNEKQLIRYQVSEQEIDQLLARNPNTFSVASYESIATGDSIAKEVKIKAFRDYASWLDGRATSRKDLEEVARNINQFGLISSVGFDRYAIKDLRYSLTKGAVSSGLKSYAVLLLWLTIGCALIGALMYILPKLSAPPGIKNNGVFLSPLKNTGWLGILVGTWLIGFYVLLYFYPEFMVNWIVLVDPISTFLNGGEAGRFFLYGFLYTICILVMGVRMIIHYRHSRYQILRTLSVMFFQTAFAFFIPEIMVRLNQPYFDFKNIWPLDYSFFFNYRIDELLASGGLGIFMLVWGIVLIVVAVPVLVFFFGKRWYCSWVCGCGGLAETLGDPYRQLSNKSIKAWKIERWMIHGVLVFAVVMTGGVLYTYFTGSAWVFVFDSYKVREMYGALIGAGFAGVVGTGFYPLMGNRVWCRFGCPLAAYLGIVQRFKSRFRITTNGGQCISCGNCSTYCEMGIDVRWYAQRGQNIVRSSCVGCGVCSSVCPRGVLNLEVNDQSNRITKPILIGNNGVALVE